MGKEWTHGSDGSIYQEDERINHPFGSGQSGGYGGGGFGGFGTVGILLFGTGALFFLALFLVPRILSLGLVAQLIVLAVNLVATILLLRSGHEKLIEIVFVATVLTVFQLTNACLITSLGKILLEHVKPSLGVPIVKWTSFSLLVLHIILFAVKMGQRGMLGTCLFYCLFVWLFGEVGVIVPLVLAAVSVGLFVLYVFFTNKFIFALFVIFFLLLSVYVLDMLYFDGVVWTFAVGLFSKIKLGS